MRRRTKAFYAVVEACLLLAGLSGCGQSASASASQAATQYAQDVLAGNGSGACALTTPAGRQNLDAAGAIFDNPRYSVNYALGGTCVEFYNALISGSIGPNGTLPSLTSVQSVKVTGAKAVVVFPSGPDGQMPYVMFMGGRYANELDLALVNGHWLVDGESYESRQQLIAEDDATPACVAAWNTAVDGGQVQPPDLEGFASEQIWTTIFGGGAGCSEPTVIIDTPVASITYDGQNDGSWIEPPASSPPAEGAELTRNVWIDAAGTATPASDASPDGVIPALDAVESISPVSSGRWFTRGRGPAAAANAPAVATGGQTCPDILNLGTTGAQPAAGVDVTVSPNLTCALASQVAHSVIGSSHTSLADLAGDWTCVERITSVDQLVCTAADEHAVAFALGFPPMSSTTSTTSTATGPASTVVAHPASASDVEALTAAATTTNPPGMTMPYLPPGYYLGDAKVTNNGWAVATPLARNPADQGDGVLIFKRVAGNWKVVSGGSDSFPGVPTAVLHALYR